METSTIQGENKLVTVFNPDRIPTAINLPIDQIVDFCDRWQICEFSLFGSVLRDDFRPDSDIDILVDFDPGAKRGLKEAFQMQDELEVLFHRKVDLIPKAAIARSENWLRRKNILESAKTIYATRSRISN
jgi:predicted nucleotidyltransferase